MLVITNWVRQQQRMQMAVRCSKETAEQYRHAHGSKEPGGSLLSRDSCSGRHQMGTKAGEFGEPPVQRDSRTGGSQKGKRSSAECWVLVRRDYCAVWCPEGKRPRAGGKLSSRWACCLSWSWSRWFRRYQPTHMEKTLVAPMTTHTIRRTIVQWLAEKHCLCCLNDKIAVPDVRTSSK